MDLRARSFGRGADYLHRLADKSARGYRPVGGDVLGEVGVAEFAVPKVQALGCGREQSAVVVRLKEQAHDFAEQLV